MPLPKLWLFAREVIQFISAVHLIEICVTDSEAMVTASMFFLMDTYQDLSPARVLWIVCGTQSQIAMATLGDLSSWMEFEYCFSDQIGILLVPLKSLFKTFRVDVFISCWKNLFCLFSNLIVNFKQWKNILNIKT